MRVSSVRLLLDMIEITLAALLVAVLVLGPSAFLAWLLMLGLGGLGVNVAFFPLWAVVFVVGCIFGGARTVSR